MQAPAARRGNVLPSSSLAVSWFPALGVLLAVPGLVLILAGMADVLATMFAPLGVEARAAPEERNALTGVERSAGWMADVACHNRDTRVAPACGAGSPARVESSPARGATPQQRVPTRVGLSPGQDLRLALAEMAGSQRGRPPHQAFTNGVPR
jgi:hypothetical protein